MKKHISILIILAFLIGLFPIGSVSAATVTVGKTSGLVAVSTLQSSVKLDWGNVSKATGYEIYSYNFTKGAYYKTLTVKSSVATISNLSSATNYKFKVRAYRTVSGKTYRGTFSSVLKVTTKPKKATGLTISSYTQTSVTFKWNAVSKATGYRIYIYNTVAKKYERLDSTTKTSYTVKGLTPATLKRVKVCAYRRVDGKAIFGASSDSLLVGTRPETPTKLSASRSESGNTVISFSGITGASGYMIYKYSDTAATYKLIKNTTETTVELTTVPFGANLFKVRAYRKSGDKCFLGYYSAVLDTDEGYNTQWENEVLTILNQKRKTDGLSQLTMTDKMRAAARVRAKEMYDAGVLSHTRPDGTGCQTIFAEFDLGVISPSGATLKNWGENIARGYGSPQAVYDAWYGSDGHRANMLRPAFNYIGVGYYKGYWVQLFTS